MYSIDFEKLKDKKAVMVFNDKEQYFLAKDVYDNLLYHKIEVPYFVSNKVSQFYCVEKLEKKEIFEIRDLEDYYFIFFNEEDKATILHRVDVEYQVIICNIVELDGIRNYIDDNGNEINCNREIANIKVVLYGNNNKIYIDESTIIGDNVKLELHNNSRLILFGENYIGNNSKIIIYQNSQIECNGCNFSSSSELSARYDSSIRMGTGISMAAESFIFTKYNSILDVGNGCSFEKGNHIIIEEGKVTIGEDLMTSYYVDFICGDGHAIFDINSGERKNSNKKIELGNHVWIGAKSTILGGAKLENDVIVGANSVVNKEICGNNCSVVGVPAQKVSENIHWERYIQ